MSRVTVLMGGWSAERAVSLTSGKGVAEALVRLGHEVRVADLDQPDPAILLEAIRPRPDLVFNALHGTGGEDGHVQALLDLARIPYTHSGMLASALAMDKPMAKALFAAAGLPIIEGVVATRAQIMAGAVLPAPYVVKPTNEGSSVGIIIVREGANRMIESHELRDTMLVERFIPGRELTVAVLDDRALPPVEIVSRGAWYDYDAKYAEGGSAHLCPAPIPQAVAAEAQLIALAAHKALGCRGVTRSDLRYDDTAGEPGSLHLMEVNTQPGMTPTSLVPDAAAAVGISYDMLVQWMVEHATCDA